MHKPMYPQDGDTRSERSHDGRLAPMIQIHLPSFLETALVTCSFANDNHCLRCPVPRQVPRRPSENPPRHRRAPPSVGTRSWPVTCRTRRKKGTASPVAPYLTGTSFSNERTVRQIPCEIASGERGRGHHVMARSLAHTSHRTRHSDAASHSCVSGTTPVRSHDSRSDLDRWPLTFRTTIISNLNEFKMECLLTSKNYIFEREFV